MNYILEAIENYPEHFNTSIGDNLSEDDLLAILVSVKKLGTSVQQNSMVLTKLYFGWVILLKVGLRPIAMPMGVQLLKDYNWNNHFLYAAEISNQLLKHFYLVGNGQEANKYEHLFKQYREAYYLETEMESIYLKIHYKYERGIELNNDAIIKNLTELESRLDVDSYKFRFYYYKCKIILSEGKDREVWCLRALKYFESISYEHEIYQNVLVKNLYNCYLEVGKYEKVISELPKYILKSIEGSKSWFRLKYIYISALYKSKRYSKARKEMNYCKTQKAFSVQSLAHIEEWEYLGYVIMSEI